MNEEIKKLKAEIERLKKCALAVRQSQAIGWKFLTQTWNKRKR